MKIILGSNMPDFLVKHAFAFGQRMASGEIKPHIDGRYAFGPSLSDSRETFMISGRLNKNSIRVYWQILANKAQQEAWTQQGKVHFG